MYESSIFPSLGKIRNFGLAFLNFCRGMSTVIQVFGEFNGIFGGQVESGWSVGVKLDNPNE